jgi:homoserine O-acetyltransferase
MTIHTGQSKPAASAESVTNVESLIAVIHNFPLECGHMLPTLHIAYETYGTLDDSGSNVILVAHGYASSHHAAGYYRQGHEPAGVNPSELGWWDSLIGPGKVLDTDNFCIISSNMIGSSYGSTGPASINPLTGNIYGPEFPNITMVDIVAAQRRLLDILGVKHLIAVVGASYGGYLAFQWAVTYPDMMSGIAVMASAPRGSGSDLGVSELRGKLAKDEHWNEGWYYGSSIKDTLINLRKESLEQYGIHKQLSRVLPDIKARATEIERLAQSWANSFDGNSLVILRRAADQFDAQRYFQKIRTKVLFVLSSTDPLFPSSLGPVVLEKLLEQGIDATYYELHSELAHLAPYGDAALLAPTLRAFLNRISDAD